MIETSFLLDAVIVAVAAAAPWWLAFDHAGLRRASRNPGAKRQVFMALAMLFSVVFATGFVALWALGGGEILALDGLAAMEALLPLWLPVLVLSAALSTRRQTAVGA